MRTRTLSPKAAAREPQQTALHHRRGRRGGRLDVKLLFSVHANQCKTVKQLQKGTVAWKTPAWKSLVFPTRARSQRDGSRQSCAAASHSLLKIAAVRIDE